MEQVLAGYDTRYVTMRTTAPVKLGGLVSMAGTNEVANAGDGDAPMGVAVSQRGNQCLVQMGGPVTFPYTGFAPSCGYNKLVVTATGGVKLDEENGREVLVVGLDIARKEVTFLL